MIRAGAFVLIVGAMLLARWYGGELAAPGSSAALALGFALIAAYLQGGVAERLRLPRISGYLVFGVLCGPYLLNLITSTMARELRVVDELALTLIAVIAGLEMNIVHLRRQARSVLAIGGLTMMGTVIVIMATLLIAWPWLPLPGLTGATRVAAALVIAALVTSFSPTVSIAVVAESRARGPLTELVMASVILADLLLIVVFALGLQLVRWAGGTEGGDVGVVVALAWEMAGSVAFGAAVGSVFALYLRYVRRELTLALLTVCAVLAVASARWHFELILSALAAGLVVENVAPPEGDDLKRAIERSGLPLIVIFFAAAGASLQLDALAALGWTAVALASIRLGCIRGFAEVGVRWLGLGASPARMAWMGLVSQAGVTLGLATIVATEFPDWGPTIRVLVVALTALHVLVGPILLKAALQRAGEVAA